KEPKMPASTPKVKLSWLPKIGLRKKVEEAKEPKMPASTPKVKLSWLPRIGLRKRAVETKKAEEIQPPVEQKAELAAGESTAEKKTEQPVQPTTEATSPKPVESTV
ncbi:MAG: hypothetical protein AABZ77_05880, partial [Chloroflexota bacterium]